jgi:hypothetical protein
VNSIGSIDYNTGAHGSLKFESSYDPPVTLGSGPSGPHGADQGFNWDNVHTYWDMGFGTPIDYIDTFPSSYYPSYGPTTPPPGSSSTRAFLLGATTVGDRNQLNLYMQDGTPTSGNDIGGMNGAVYYKQWIYIPTNFICVPQKLGGVSLRLASNGNGYYDETGYWSQVQVFGYREAGVTGALDEMSIALNFQSMTTGNTFYMYLDERAYIGQGAGFYWDDWYVNLTTIPTGQWFLLEVYIVRSATDPVIKVWVNGVTWYALDKNNMYTLHNHVGAGNGNVYDYQDPQFGTQPFTSRGVSTKFYEKALVFYSTDITYQAPAYWWVDDLEIWNGLPP